jgi:protein CpxP
MKRIGLILASALLIGGAYAQSPPGSAAATPVLMQPATAPSGGVEKHIRALHLKLKITAAQESQWADVAQTMRDSATELDKAIDKREAIVGSATALENLNAYGDIAQAHVDSVRKLATAFSTLYSSMSDDQKKVADDVFAQRPHGASH